jgi:glucokinase-like ROK family protein
VSLRPGPHAALQRPHAAALLRLIWAERGVSRADLAQRTGLVRSTVSQTVQALLAAGLVSEEGVGPSSGGRRPVFLRFEDDAFGVVGIDLGHTHVSVALTNLRGRVTAWEERRHRVRTDPAGTRALTAELIEACLSRWDRPRARLVAIGVALPSPVDRGAAHALSRVALPAWEGEPGLAPLGERFGVPVLLENDANMGALAEHRWGAGRQVKDLVYLKISNGLGAGLILGGALHGGHSGLAGELGHLPLDPAGPRCACGMRGCLTTLVDVAAVLARAEAARAAHPGSRLDGRDLSLAVVDEAARAGDAVAGEVVAETARWLALGLAGLVNLFNPGMVVVGGGLARLGETLLEPVRCTVRELTLVPAAAEAQIVASPLGDRAIALGAATHALETALADLRLFPTVGPARLPAPEPGPGVTG